MQPYRLPEAKHIAEEEQEVSIINYNPDCRAPSITIHGEGHIGRKDDKYEN